MQNDILKYLTNQRKKYQEEMNNIEKKLKQEFNSNTIQEAAILIEKANQFIKNYKYTNLEYLKNEINKIINQYKEESNEILKIDEQIEEIKNK